MTEEQQEIRRTKARERMRAYVKTEAYREYLERSLDFRNKLKEKYRRQSGSRSLDEIAADAKRKEEEREAIKNAKREAIALLHDAHVKTMRGLSDAEEFRWRYKTDHEFNIRQRLRTQLRKQRERFPKIGDLARDAINRNGKSETVEKLCGYSVIKLREHLEMQFTKGMTWDRFMAGDIHIDHIIPKSSFDLTSIDDVRKCWCLSNLRPMWAKENVKKGKKIECLL